VGSEDGQSAEERPHTCRQLRTTGTENARVWSKSLSAVIALNTVVMPLAP